ncbi:LysM peptidoglycan-binding domain-containing protein [Nocardioides caeni]|uniref:LysM peptidoglycan-binding domain-containing protein n=1 Tax=Nocardioides caeni TaxID=574700 RepID=A0A4S8NPK4_9ACTN|nr:LysM peptidoglycan-binding domain-containing protein [Nocardioides caeni]THV18172.1 LysM peptidoglycan-binding domain-containing protein [Nocardioides caeni]
MNHAAAARRRRRLRSLLVWATITALCSMLLMATLRGALVPLRTPPDFAELVLQVAGSGALAAAGALWLLATHVVVDVWRDRASRPGGAARRLLLVACGVTTAAALTLPPAQAHRAAEAPSVPLAGLPLPDRATGGAPPAGPTPHGHTVVVQTGDSAWSIAARAVAATTPESPAPSNAAVASYWRRLVELNRAALGDDPDLIHPGLRLHLPDPPRSER